MSGSQQDWDDYNSPPAQSSKRMKLIDPTELSRLRAIEAAARAKDAAIDNLRTAFIMSHNGDIQIKWNPDGFWAYGRDRDQSLVRLAGPCDEAIDAALAALAAQPGGEG